MGEDLGDERDPLLVRPFVLSDGARQEEPPSSVSTWPVEQRAGETPTQLLPTIPGVLSGAPEQDAPKTPRHRRTLLLIGAGAVAVASVAGYALLRPTGQDEAWMSLPGQSLPAAIGPARSADAIHSSVPHDGGTDGGGQDDSDEGTEPTRPTRAASASASSAGGSVSPSAGSSGGSSSSSVPVAPVAPIDLAPSPIATGSGLLATGNGLCLDLRGGQASEGADVHIDDCNGTSPQRWKLNSNQTLEVLGMCAYLVGDGTVELTRCDGRTTAQWQLKSDGVLTNPSNGRCLTDPFWGARPGNAVIVATCTGGSNQRWSFR
ncbi:ricin-type beta-trefoil lectin domain protein [Actinoplanes sp. CA-252034]|uniref:ricin-type beta-trefoil lectin domain protein n=1 Tax=Actinoplanes sp. CA-252034 TaxID=3239906 RepID=UPI003D9876FA